MQQPTDKKNTGIKSAVDMLSEMGYAFPDSAQQDVKTGKPVDQAGDQDVWNQINQMAGVITPKQPQAQQVGTPQQPSQREQDYFNLSGERQDLQRERGRLKKEGTGVNYDRLRDISGRLKTIEGEIEQLKPEGAGIRIINGLNNFMSGAAEMPAGALKGVAVLAKQIDDALGTNFQPGDVSDQQTYKWGERISELAKEHFPTDPVLQEEFTQQLSAGLGSFLSFGVGGIGARALTGSVRGGQAFAVGAAGTGGMGQQYDEAIQHDASEDDAVLAANWGFLPGVVQVSNTALRVLNRWDKAYGGALKESLARRVVESGKTGINEAIVETLGQAGYNKIAQEIYDAERPLVEGLGEAGSVGGSAGFLSDLLMSAFLGKAGGRGTRSDRPRPSLDEAKMEIEKGNDAPSPAEMQARQQTKQPLGIGIYNDQDVTVLATDPQGDYYIEVTDPETGQTSQKHVQKEEVTDTVGWEEAEAAAQAVEQTEQMQAKLQQTIQDPETGEYYSPDDPGYEQVAQRVQQRLGEQKQLVVGTGDKRQSVTMSPTPGGEFQVTAVDGAPITDMNATETNDLVNKISAELEGRGEFIVEMFPDMNDPMGAMQVMVIPGEGASFEAQQQTESVDTDQQDTQPEPATNEFEGYEVLADGATVKVLNPEGEEVGKQSIHYQRVLEDYFSATAADYSGMPRATDNNADVTPENFTDEVARYSENPVEIAEAYQMELQNQEDTEAGRAKEIAIAEDLARSRIPSSDLQRRGIDSRIVYAQYAQKNADTDLAQRAEYLSDQLGMEVTIDDMLDFIRANPSGPKAAISRKNDIVQRLEDRFKEVTGVEITSKLADTLVENNMAEQTQFAQPEIDVARQQDLEQMSDEELAELETQLLEAGIQREEIDRINRQAETATEQEITDAEAAVENAESEAEALAELEAFFEQQGQDQSTILDYSQTDSQGREYTYRAVTKTDDQGYSTIDYEFNRSDKDSDTWNKTGVPIGETGFSDKVPAPDTFPDGNVNFDDYNIKVHQVRVAPDGKLDATVTFEHKTDSDLTIRNVEAELVDADQSNQQTDEATQEVAPQDEGVSAEAEATESGAEVSEKPVENKLYFSLPEKDGTLRGKFSKEKNEGRVHYELRDHGDGTASAYLTNKDLNQSVLDQIDSYLKVAFNVGNLAESRKTSSEIYLLEPAQYRKEGNDWKLVQKGKLASKEGGDFNDSTPVGDSAPVTESSQDANISDEIADTPTEAAQTDSEAETTGDAVSGEMESQERDLSTRKEYWSNLPIPNNPTHFTPSEFEAFLIDNNYPPNTLDDRMDGHKQQVVEALTKDEFVPQEVIDEYGDVFGLAESEKKSAKAWEERIKRVDKQVNDFQESISPEDVAIAINVTDPNITNYSNKIFEIELDYPNPLGTDTWTVRYFNEKNYNEYRVFRNKAQAESNVDPFRTVDADLVDATESKPYYLKERIDRVFEEDITRSNGDPFKTIGSAKRAAKYIDNPQEYTIAKSGEGFILTKTENVPDGFYSEGLKFTDAGPTVEVIKSNEVEQREQTGQRSLNDLLDQEAAQETSEADQSETQQEEADQAVDEATETTETEQAEATAEPQQDATEQADVTQSEAETQATTDADSNVTAINDSLSELGVRVEEDGDLVLFVGNTDAAEGAMKKIGATWDSQKEGWALPKSDADKIAEAVSVLQDKAQPMKKEDVVQSDQDNNAQPDSNAEVSTAEEMESSGMIKDFGEKIGMARKDTAESGWSRNKGSKKSDLPGWARKYKVWEQDGDQTVVMGGWKRTELEKGKYAIVSTRKKNITRHQVNVESEAEAYDMIPLIEVSRNHRVYQSRENADEYGIFRRWSSGKLWEIKSGFESEQAAKEYMAKNPEEIIEYKEPRIERPHLDVLKREGIPVRDGDVTPEQFMEVFGLRGGEFGNWVRSDERQRMLNYAYDSFSDLAHFLGVSKNAISLGGRLAIGFGSRGQGLSSAAAHFERDRGVINLTKIHGAGSLAHEWFHAMDSYFGIYDRKKPNKSGVIDNLSDSDFLSHQRRNRNVRDEVMEAWRGVYDAMMYKTEYSEYDTDASKRRVNAQRDRLKSSLDYYRRTMAEERSYGRRKKPATEDQLARWDALIERIDNSDFGEVVVVPNKKKYSEGDRMYEVQRDLSDLHKEVTGRSIKDLSEGSFAAILRSENILEDAKAGEGYRKKVKSTFLRDSKEIDKRRSSDYWSTPHEMAARAFEAYLHDKMSSSDAQNDYLVHSVSNAIYVALYDAKPYPEGSERASINESLDKFFEAVNEKEEGGNAVLFSLDNYPKTTATDQKRIEIRDAIKTITSQWVDDSFVNVVDTIEDLPRALRMRIQREGNERSVTGVFVGNDVYIIADHARSPQDAINTLKHETIGHLGMRALVAHHSFNRRDFEGRLDSILSDVFESYKDDPLMQKIKQNYSLDFRKKSDQAVAAEEFLAKTAEGNIDASIWERITKWFNDLLKSMGFDGKPVTMADIKQRLRDSQAFVEGNYAGIYQRDGSHLYSVFMNLDPGTFYSNALDGLTRITQPAATPNQWVQMIADSGGRGTAQELEWVGLKDFLDGYIAENNTKSVPKDVVEQYIQDNRIQIEEVTLGDTGESALVNEEELMDLSMELEDMGYKYEYQMDGEYGLTDTDNNPVEYSDLPPDAQAIATRLERLESFNQTDRVVEGQAKFGEYTLPGGENYREVLLTLPLTPDKNAGKEIKDKLTSLGYKVDGDDIYSEDGLRVFGRGGGAFEYGQEIKSTDGKVIGKVGEKGVAELVSELAGVLGKSFADQQTSAYRSSHFDQKNVLAHVRVNDRTLANGDKVLFIEELQSDWAQEGRKRGFKGGSRYSAKKWDGETDLSGMMGVDLVKKGDWIIYEDNQPKISIESDSTTEQGVIDEYLELAEETETPVKSAIPDMPYKQTDQWAGMAIRRVMGMAAEQGYDRIAWTTGEQQAERYDLSKQVDSVRIEETNGKYDLQVFKDGERVITKNSLTKNELSDNIGKELTDKFLSQNKNIQEYSGVDLKVGGEGMKGFYNSILPKVAKKEARRFDKKAKVEVIEIDSNKQLSIKLTDKAKENLGSAVPMFSLRESEQTKQTIQQEIDPETDMSIADYGEQRKVPGNFGRIARLKGLFIEPLHWLEQQPQLKPLADKVRNHYDDWARRRGFAYGRAHENILKPLSKLKRKQRNEILEQFEDYMRLRETGSKEQAEKMDLHPLARQMVDYTSWIGVYAGSINRQVGVQVFDPAMVDWNKIEGRVGADGVAQIKKLPYEQRDAKYSELINRKNTKLPRKGGWRGIGQVKNFFPRKMNRQTEAALRNPTKNKEHWNKLVDALIDEGYVETRAEADKYLKLYIQDYTENNYFAGIEKARTQALPSIAYDYRFEVMLDYMNQWSERVSQIQHFGQVTTEDSKDAFDKMLGQASDEQTRKFISALQDRVYNKNSKDGFYQGISVLNKLATGLQLGNFGTASLNIVGGTTLNFMANPTLPSLKALLHLAKPDFHPPRFRGAGFMRALSDMVEFKNLADAIQEGRTRGAINNDMIMLLRDTNNVEGFLKTPKVLQYLGLPENVEFNEALDTFVNTTMKWGGYIPTEMFIRSHAQLSAKYALQDKIADIKKSATSRKSLRHIRSMQEHGFDYRRLVNEDGKGLYTERYLRYMSNLTQGSYKVDQVPIHLDTPTGRFFFKYVKFITQVSRMWYKDFYRPFAASVLEGGSKVQVEVDGVMTTQRVFEFTKMMKFFAASAIGGEIVRNVRNILFDYAFQGPEIEEIEKALEDDDRMKALALIFDRAFWNIQATGGLLVFGNYAQLTRDAFSRQRARNPLEPPGFGVLKNTIDFGLDTYDQKGMSGKDVDNFIERQFSLYRTVKRPTLKAYSTFQEEFGLPDWHAAEFRQFEIDRNYTRGLVRRWQEQEGVQGGQQRIGRISRTENSITNARIHEALATGNPYVATEILVLASADRGRDFDRMRRSAMTSMRHRRPYGNMSQFNTEGFEQWLDKNIGKESVERVKTAEREYVSAYEEFQNLTAMILQRLRPIDNRIDQLEENMGGDEIVQRQIEELLKQRMQLIERLKDQVQTRANAAGATTRRSTNQLLD